MALKLITPPSDFPISLAEVKDRLGISANDSDAHISGLLAGATQVLEQYLSRAFIPQTWDLIYDAFPTEPVLLPIAPLISVDSVNYIDPDTAVETVLASSAYTIDNASEPGWLVVGEDGWPDIFTTVNAVRIRFTAGYALLEDGSPATPGVPAALCNAIALLVSEWFEHRSSGGPGGGEAVLPASVRAMVAAYRVFS